MTNPFGDTEVVETTAANTFGDTEIVEPTETADAVEGVTAEVTEDGYSATGDIVNTLTNIGQVYPVLEAAAQLVTSAYGVPLAGLGGLGTLIATGDLVKANKMIEDIQKTFVYTPMTPRGRQFAQSAAYPFEQYEKGAAAVGDALSRAGHPDLAATVHSSISALPAVVGSRTARNIVKPTNVKKLTKEMKSTVVDNLQKTLRPSFKQRKSYKKAMQADNKAFQAVDTIVDNKDSLVFDRDGSPVKGALPQSLEELSNSIDQTKQVIFNEFDELAKQADKAVATEPVRFPMSKNETRPIVFKEGKPYLVDELKVTTDSAVAELTKMLDDPVLRVNSPETVRYIQSKIDANKGVKYSATEAQKAIRMLNESTREYQMNPNLDTKGRAMVDTLILNHLRKGIDKTVKKATNKDYSAIKKKYAALKSIEEDTARAVNRERNKIKGLPNFSDVVSAHQVTSGLMSGSVPKVAGGALIEGFSLVRKRLRDPNRRIRKMFEEVDKRKQEIRNAKPPIRYGR